MPRRSAPLGVLLSCFLLAPPADAAPPNVVLILADDLGYNDISLHGNDFLHTPRIDSIGREGVEFTRAYTTCGTCSPSRAGLLTGRYQQRFGFEFLLLSPLITRAFDGSLVENPGHLIEKIPPKRRVSIAESGMPPSEVTIAEVLKAQGYQTGMVGKWHVGSSDELQPMSQGFDEFVGFHQVSAMYAPKDDPNIVSAYLPWSGVDKLQWAFLNNHLVRNGEAFVPDEYLTTFFGREAARFVENHSEEPFFLYLAFNAPHAPLQAPRQNYDRLAGIEDHNTRVYCAMIEAMDEAIGMVLDKLEQTGVADNTLVIFSSDNGATPYLRMPHCNQPFRGGKYTNYQGGLVVPLLMRWPDRIPAETVCDVPVSLLDVMPTIAAATDAKLPEDRPIDGVDLLPAIGATPPEQFHDALFWRSGRYKAVLSGNYRLHVDDTQGKVMLYDVSQDVGEQTNLAEKLPEKVAELKALLEEAESNFKEPAWPTHVYSRVPVDIVPEKPAADAEAVFFPL